MATINTKGSITQIMGNLESLLEAPSNLSAEEVKRRLVSLIVTGQ